MHSIMSDFRCMTNCHSLTLCYVEESLPSVTVVSDLYQWFELLLSKGPDFGYVVNAAKCCLVVHDCYKCDVEQLFSSLRVSVVCNHHYLGGFTGDTVGQATFIQDKVCHWIVDVKCLSKIAEKQPQAAFAALVKSLQWEWQFLQCVMPNYGNYFTHLDDVLTSTFLPAVFGCEMTPHKYLLFSLAVCFGGLGVFNDNVLLSLLILPPGMLPRLLFRLFMASGLLKLIAMWRLYFVLIRIL